MHAGRIEVTTSITGLEVLQSAPQEGSIGERFGEQGRCAPVFELLYAVS